MGKLQATQKIKGTDTIKISIEITGAPDNYSELIALAQDSEKLQEAVMLAVNGEARNRTIARAGSLERAKQPVPSSIDFVEVMTTYSKKITAASMCERLEQKILVIGADMQEAVMSLDFDAAKEFALDMQAVKDELAGWETKREDERLKKAESRKANEQANK